MTFEPQKTATAADHRGLSPYLLVPGSLLSHLVTPTIQAAFSLIQSQSHVADGREFVPTAAVLHHARHDEKRAGRGGPRLDFAWCNKAVFYGRAEKPSFNENPNRVQVRVRTSELMGHTFMHEAAPSLWVHALLVFRE